MTASPVKKHLTMLIITTVVFVIAAVLVWRFVILLQVKKNEVIQANEQLTSYEANKKIFAEESKSLAQITTRATRLEGYRITDATVPELLSSLEALGRKDGVDFAITTVSTPGGKNVEQKLLIDFSAKGAEGNMDAFLADLSRQSYEIKFTRLSLFADYSAPSDTVAPVKQAPATPLWDLLASIQVISY